MTKEWEEYYKEKGFFVAKVNSQKGAGIKEVKNWWKKPVGRKKNETGRGAS